MEGYGSGEKMMACLGSAMSWINKGGLFAGLEGEEGCVMLVQSLDTGDGCNDFFVGFSQGQALRRTGL